MRAKEDLKAGQILLVEPPLAMAESDGLPGKGKNALI